MCDGAHRDGGLDSRGNGVDARRQSEERYALVRIADRGGGIEAGDLGLGRVGSERLFHLGLFGARVAVAAGGLAVKLLASELEEGELGPDGECRRWSFGGRVDIRGSWYRAVGLCARLCCLWTDLGKIEGLYLL